MKNPSNFFLLLFLSIGLLVSCSQVNERIDELEKRVDDIESISMVAIRGQIEGINTSISELTDLSNTLKSQITELQKAGDKYELEIKDLKTQVEAIDKRLSELKSFLENELKKYATSDWVNATFASLEEYRKIFEDVAELQEVVGSAGAKIDSRIDAEIESAVNGAIAGIESSFRSWTGDQLKNYYTISQTDEKLRSMGDALEKAIANFGAILGTMIQTLTIVPAYDDGSVEALDSVLSINVIVKPARALYFVKAGDLKNCIKILVSDAKPAVKSVGVYEEIEVSEAVVLDYEKGVVNVTADISSELKALANGKNLTAAVEIKHGVSDFSTEFVKVTEAANDGSKKFVVLSDLHLMHPDLLEREGAAFDKYNWEECKLLRESPEILASTLERAGTFRPDFLIVCGDMSKDGEIISHKYVAEKLNEFSKRTGAKILVVPGNHDLTNPKSKRYNGEVETPEPSATEEDFEEIYAQCGYSDAVARGPRKLDYMSYPADGVAFIGVDSNEENTPDEAAVQGGLTEEQVAWITQMVQKAHNDNRYVIMGMHHNLLEYYDNAALIRGANIANAKYDEYTNGQLVSDLSAAGIDVVFSGHSHMHSISSTMCNSREIYSVVTSSLVNLPLAYRTGTISKEGILTLQSGHVQDCRPSNGVNLREEGKRYWQKLSEYYMYEASRTCWENELASESEIFTEQLGFNSRQELEDFFSERLKTPFYDFTYFTSNGNEHLFSPGVYAQEAEAAFEGVIEFVTNKFMDWFLADEESLTEEEAREEALGVIDFFLTFLLEMDLDELRTTAYDFFDSAYHNYYGADHTPVPDDAVTIQLTK